MYEEMENILDLLWKNDDRMDQETLFEVQERFADLMLKVANAEGKQKQLLKKYDWIYRAWYSWEEE